MKQQFAMTKNTARWLTAIETVRTPVRGRIGMMLAYGPPGTGKTEVGQWYANANNVPYIRAKFISSMRGLLSNIVSELCVAPAFRSEDLFEQAVDELLSTGTMLIVDEIDYLMHGGVIEVLRDLNDITNAPIVLMGMEESDKKLKRFRHFYDRLTAVSKFELFGVEDVSALAGQICEVAIDDEAVAWVQQQSGGKLRMITTWLARAESIAKRNRLESVSVANLRSYKGV